MRLLVIIASVSVAGVCLSACKIVKHVDIVTANEADATLVLQHEHGFEDYHVEWDEVEEDVLARCADWGYSDAEFAGGGNIECIEMRERTVTGARPPGQSAEPGMGTQAAERERMLRGAGTVGQSVRSTKPPPPGAEYGCVYWRVTYVGHCFNPERV